MLLKLNHKSLLVYKHVREMVKEIYTISKLFPIDEKFNLVQQIRRAAVSVKLNLAEGATRKSSLERKRYFEISRGSIVEIDASIETAIDLNYISMNDLNSLSVSINSSFAMLCKMIEACK